MSLPTAQHDLPIPDTYRAWRWMGGAKASELVLATVGTQPLGPEQVYVRNAVLGLNPVDWKVLGGTMPGWQPGHIPGVDATGVVVAVGAGVDAAWLGRRVAYHTDLHGHGSFAEYAPVAARALLPLPDDLDFVRAATFPCPGLTAWLALEKLPARAGEALLICGAGGAVGHFLVQLAAARGFIVTAMAHARHRERLLSLGASAALEGPLVGDHARTGERRFFAVIDAVSAEHALTMSQALQANGHLVCIQGRAPQWPCTPFGLSISMHEVALGALHVHGSAEAWRHLSAAGEHLLAEVSQGRLATPATVVGGFEALPTWLEALRQRSFSEKPVLRVHA